VPTITLKNIPRDLHRKIKSRAKAHHRSLNKEVIATLQAASHSTHAVDTQAMINEAREARGKFKRMISAREISTWKLRGRL